MYYELIDAGTISDYESSKVSELVKKDPEFIKKMEEYVDSANNLLATLGDVVGLDDINKIRQSDDSYKNLSEEYKLMEKIDTLRDNNKITDDQARELMYGLYVVMHEDLLATKYLENNKKLMEQASIEVVNKYGDQMKNAINGNLSQEDYKKLMTNISNVFINEYGIKDLDSRMIDPSSDIYYKVIPDKNTDFYGVIKDALVEIPSSLSMTDRKELINQGYIFYNLNGTEYLDFTKQKEVWLNLSTQLNNKANDPIHMAGTAGHEVGHDYDLSLKDKKYKTKEEEVLVKIFNMTSKPAYAGTEAKTPEYNLRGSELFQHELGGFIRAKIAKELNNKDVK